MAKKKKTQKVNPTIMTVGVLLILILGVFGIQVPDIIQDYFGTNVNVTQKQPKPSAPHSNPGPIEQGAASFTEEELLPNDKGWIEYRPLDSLERATGGDALITPIMINTGTKAKPAIRPPGFVSGNEPYNHARGHLIGRQLGGSGEDPRNLVTLYQTPVNSPFMTKYENMIRKAVDEGDVVRYRVIPIYDDKNLICKEVFMEAKSLSKKGTINFRVTIPNLQ